MANQSDDVIGNFLGLVSSIFGDIIPHTNHEISPLASAPPAVQINDQLPEGEKFDSKRVNDAVASAELAANRSRAAAAAAAAAKARAEAERDRAPAPDERRVRFADPEATRAEDAARARVEAERARAAAERAAAEARARAEAAAEAEAGVQGMRAIRAAAEKARARAAAEARARAAAPAPAVAPAVAAAVAVGENYTQEKVSDPPKADLSYYKLAKLMAPGAITLACVTCLAVGASSVATFGAVPLAIGIAIGVGSIAYYSRTRKNSSEVESKPKEAESEVGIIGFKKELPGPYPCIPLTAVKIIKYLGIMPGINQGKES